ncbi:recombinase family protein [Thalassobius sp. Cn5-15]|uniref:recombinase family protein n=1 Tax=Thalassobius sp. Cn5-15 TaxID=2917763 RepID=UPI001EF228CD|nr:recombinase family protein [Thalassobius sp. Cn5-15]MCG7493305.1 recombinase family protein [Thalassobius sp. Cn5-15]
MHSDVIRKAIIAGKANLYRRVSTPKQAEDGYKYQLECIKDHYPEFTISNSTNISVKEVISGRCDTEVRMATGLRKCLRHLKRHQSEILLVSSDDRISRRAEVFELIQKQGLGKRIYDASTGMNVDDIIELNHHHKVEELTNAKREAQFKAIARLMADGQAFGSPDIAKHSKKGSITKTRLADEREAQVLSVIANMTYRGGGQKPSYEEISDELDLQGIRTGQNRFLTPKRLCQLRKRSPEKWDYAFDTYHRPRRRIRELVQAAKTEVSTKRIHRRRRIWLSSKTIIDALLYGLTWRDLRSLTVGDNHLCDQIRTQAGEVGCRSPPTIWLCLRRVQWNVRRDQLMTSKTQRYDMVFRACF